MSSEPLLQLNLEAPSIRLHARETPWDTVVFGVKVVQLESIDVLDIAVAGSAYAEFQAWLDAESVGIVSCRLPHERLRESMFLEDHGFRFVEMVLHPRMKDLLKVELESDELVVAPAEAADLEWIRAIAEKAFSHERYHVDPRLDPRLGDQRYGRWAVESLNHPKQTLLKISHSDRMIGTFIVEQMADRSVYWHLTAIAPEWQGQGYGRRAWRAMLRSHQLEGINVVTTTISARNSSVFNLYAQLNFRFSPPHMTFHWVRPAQ